MLQYLTQSNHTGFVLTPTDYQSSHEMLNETVHCTPIHAVALSQWKSMAQKIQLLNHKNSSSNVGCSDNQNEGIYGILSVDKNFQGFSKQLGPNLITMKKKGTKKSNGPPRLPVSAIL